MYELRFSASQHHIPPLPLGHSTLINPAAAEKVMQEPHFGAFLHHFPPIPGKRPELEVRAGFGPLSDEIARRAATRRASLSHPISRKERIDDEHHIPPFVVNSNHLLASPAFPTSLPISILFPTEPPGPPGTPGI